MHKLIAVILSASTLAAAEPAVYESFNYAEGRCEGQQGGSGWAGSWTDGHNAIKAGSLTSKIGQTPKSAGGHFVTTNRDWAAKRLLTDKLGEKPGTVYLSLLLRNDTGLRQENYGFVNVCAGDKTAFSIGQGYFGEKWSLGGLKEVGSQVSSNSTDAVFVVLKATWAGAAGKVEAYFYPDLAKEPKSADIVADGVELPVVDRVAIVGKNEFSVDEIRIGPSWAAVCPAQ